jgi:hypothetical protein
MCAGVSRHGLQDLSVFAFGNVTERFTDLRCVALSSLSEGCRPLGVNQGEWRQLLAGLDPGQRLPAEHNTLDWAFVRRLTDPSQAMWVHRSTDVLEADLIAPLDAMRHETVVYVPKLFHVVAHTRAASEAAVRRSVSRAATCPPLLTGLQHVAAHA